jgi:hypothetical protein
VTRCGSRSARVGAWSFALETRTAAEERDAVIAWGDEDKIALRVRQHLDAGADHVCVQVVAEEDDDVALTQLREPAPALLGL